MASLKTHHDLRISGSKSQVLHVSTAALAVKNDTDENRLTCDVLYSADPTDHCISAELP